jgi:hypothetical protein
MQPAPWPAETPVDCFLLGGVAMSVTGTWIGYKWLKRKMRRAT